MDTIDVTFVKKVLFHVNLLLVVHIVHHSAYIQCSKVTRAFLGNLIHCLSFFETTKEQRKKEENSVLVI